MNSYYELLGVPPNATEMEIRSAYGRDVLRLQETASDKVAQFCAALDAAFATLVDPTRRSAYDAQLATATQEHAADSTDDATDAFRCARNGGLWFAGGGLVAAATYAFSEGTYFLAWGPLLFGGFRLVRGLLRYLKVPGGARQASHLAILAGLIAVGVLSASFVGVTEQQAAREANHLEKWNAMIDVTALQVTQASELVNGVASRPGPWDATDSADMGEGLGALQERRRPRRQRDHAVAIRVVSRGHVQELPRSGNDHPRVLTAHRRVARECVRGTGRALGRPRGRGQRVLGSLRGAGEERSLAREDVRDRAN